jgi:hypothetical protein
VGHMGVGIAMFQHDDMEFTLTFVSGMQLLKCLTDIYCVSIGSVVLCSQHHVVCLMTGP